MPWNRIPDVEVCCGCVADLKTAAAIIAVLGIVTSPSVSWVVVRHSYMIRISCLLSTNQARPDVVDVNINNVLSFGFGANAGLGDSCLGGKKENRSPEGTPENPTLVLRTNSSSTKTEKSTFVKAVQYIGWIVLIFDLFFLISSIIFLLKIFNAPNQRAAKIFILTGIIAMFLSFIYSMIYIAACVVMGGGFPIFEFVFAFIDMLIWAYFLMVVNSYRRSLQNMPGQSQGPVR